MNRNTCQTIIIDNRITSVCKVRCPSFQVRYMISLLQAQKHNRLDRGVSTTFTAYRLVLSPGKACAAK